MSKIIIKRRLGQELVVGGPAVIRIMKGGRVAVFADKSVPVWRGELDEGRAAEMRGEGQKEGENHGAE